MQLGQSERKLEETKNQLSRLQGQHNILTSRDKLEAGMVNVKVQKRSTNPYQIIPHSAGNQSGSVLEPVQGSVKSSKESGGTVIQNSSIQNKTKPRTQIVVPSINTVTPQSSKSHLGAKASNGSVSVPTHANTLKSSGLNSRKISSEQDSVNMQSKGTKRKFGNAVTCYGYNFTCLFDFIAAVIFSVTKLLLILHNT